LLVHARMNRLASQCEHIFSKHLFQVNKPALARAIAPVLKGGDGDWVFQTLSYSLDKLNSRGHVFFVNKHIKV